MTQTRQTQVFFVLAHICSHSELVLDWIDLGYELPKSDRSRGFTLLLMVSVLLYTSYINNNLRRRMQSLLSFARWNSLSGLRSAMGLELRTCRLSLLQVPSPITCYILTSREIISVTLEMYSLGRCWIYSLLSLYYVSSVR